MERASIAFSLVIAIILARIAIISGPMQITSWLISLQYFESFIFSLLSAYDALASAMSPALVTTHARSNFFIFISSILGGTRTYSAFGMLLMISSQVSNSNGEKAKLKTSVAEPPTSQTAIWTA